MATKKTTECLFIMQDTGHTLDNNGTQMGYVVPIDAPMPNKDERGFISKALPMTQFKTWSESSTYSKHSLFIFDACFAGSIFSSRGGETDEVINYNTANYVRQFIASGSADETVPDKSVFCTQFVYALTSNAADANKDGYMTGTELGEYLKNTVIQYRKNRQHPQYGKLDNPSFDKGDFVFVIEKQSDIPEEESVTFEDEELAPLTTYGYVKISNYLQGSLYIDGTYIKIANKNKLIKEKIAIGRHTIKITTDNETWEQSVTSKRRLNHKPNSKKHLCATTKQQ